MYNPPCRIIVATAFATSRSKDSGFKKGVRIDIMATLLGILWIIFVCFPAFVIFLLFLCVGFIITMKILQGIFWLLAEICGLFCEEEQQETTNLVSTILSGEDYTKPTGLKKRRVRSFG